MDLDAGLRCGGRLDGPSPLDGQRGSASDGLGPAFAMDFEDPEGAGGVERCLHTSVVSRKMGGLF